MKITLAALSLTALVTVVTAEQAAATGPADDLAVRLGLELAEHEGLLVAVADVETLLGFELRGRLSFLMDGNVIDEAPLITDSWARIGFVVGYADRRSEVCVILAGDLRTHGDSGREVLELECGTWTPRPVSPASASVADSLAGRADRHSTERSGLGGERASVSLPLHRR